MATQRLWRSLRDASKHKPMTGIPEGSPRAELPATLESLESALGQTWKEQARKDDKLIASVQRQEHPAFCGIAAAATVAAAADGAITEQTRFAEAFDLNGFQSTIFDHYGWGSWGTVMDYLPAPAKRSLLQHIQYDGVPMSVLAEWFRVQGWRAEPVSAADADLQTFRKDIEAAFPAPREDQGVSSSSSQSNLGGKCYVMVNYSRVVVGQLLFSGGHYAPIGAYHPGQDKVLILDVNTRRYPSVWADLPLLWDAVHTQTGNGSWRGYLRLHSPSSPPTAAPQ